MSFDREPSFSPFPVSQIVGGEKRFDTCRAVAVILISISKQLPGDHKVIVPIKSSCSVLYQGQKWHLLWIGLLNFGMLASGVFSNLSSSYLPVQLVRKMEVSCVSRF